VLPLSGQAYVKNVDLHKGFLMMNTSSTIGTDNDHGATAVITHRVKKEKHVDYEKWLDVIAPRCKAADGYLDWQIVRPIPGLSETFTVIIRFDTSQHLKIWMDSSVRAELIEKANSLFVNGDDFFISSGLDFWFTPSGAKAKLPVRWKQYLLTWSAIYPLALLVPMLVSPVFNWLGLPHNNIVLTLCVTAVIVFLMVYVIMPRYTKLLAKWLFS
jgi:uncharacterized protein